MIDLVWPELVLHVLAHLEATSHLPSSVYSQSYVDAAQQHLGPAAERALGQDIRVLSAHLTTHEQLSRVQMLTLLHPTLECARRVSHLELSSLLADGNTNQAVRDLLTDSVGPTAELLRCAALLEADAFLGWPLPKIEVVQSQLELALPEFWSVAPRLRSLPIRPLRVLGMRGRAFPDALWVGIPVENGEPSLYHVLCQAAHEATVLEVGERSRADGRPVSERSVEQIAVALLARRVSTTNIAPHHTRWLRQLAPEVACWAMGNGLSVADWQWLQTFSLHPTTVRPMQEEPTLPDRKAKET